jgi:hypothetical protein
MKNKLILILFTCILLTSSVFGSQWTFNGVTNFNVVPTLGTYGAVNSGILSSGSPWVEAIENVSPTQHIVMLTGDTTKASFTASTTFDFKWSVPGQNPTQALSYTGNYKYVQSVLGSVSNFMTESARATSETNAISIYGDTSHGYGFYNGRTTNVAFSGTSSTYVLASDGYYHCYVPVNGGEVKSWVALSNPDLGQCSVSASTKLTASIISY